MEEKKEVRTLIDRASLSVLANGLEVGLTSISRILTVAVLARYWPTSTYGDWILIIALTEYLSLADFGFIDALSTKVVLLASSRKKSRSRQLFYRTLLFVGANRIFFALLSLSLIFLLPVEKWLGLSGLTTFDEKRTLFFLSLFALATPFYRIMLAAYQSAGLNARGVTLISLNLFLESVLLVLLVILGAGPAPVALSLLVFRSFLAALLFVQVRKTIPTLVSAPPRTLALFIRFIVRKAKLSDPVVGVAFGTQAHVVSSLLLNQGILLMIGRFFASNAVIGFSTLRTFGRLFSQPWNMVARAVSPELSLEYGSGMSSSSIAFFVRVLRYSLWGTAGLFLIAIVGGEVFYLWWTKNIFPFDRTLFALLGVSITLGTLSGNCVQILTSVNQQRRYCFILVTLSAFMVAWFALFKPPTALEEVAFGLCLGDAFMVMIGLSEVSKLFALNLKQLYKAVFTLPRKSDFELILKARTRLPFLKMNPGAM